MALSADGDAPPYEHGRTDNAVATISLAPAITAGGYYIEPSETEYELLSEEEIEARFLFDQEDDP